MESYCQSCRLAACNLSSDGAASISSMLSCCSKIRSSSCMLAHSNNRNPQALQPCSLIKSINANTFIEIHTVHTCTYCYKMWQIYPEQFHLLKSPLFKARWKWWAPGMIQSQEAVQIAQPRGCRRTRCLFQSPVVCDSGPRQSPQFQAQHLQGGVRLHTWTSQVKGSSTWREETNVSSECL